MRRSGPRKNQTARSRSTEPPAYFGDLEFIAKKPPNFRQAVATVQNLAKVLFMRDDVDNHSPVIKAFLGEFVFEG
jgi:hypothetical protein